MVTDLVTNSLRYAGGRPATDSRPGDGRWQPRARRPAAELPAVARALDVTFVAVSPRGGRDIAAARFFHGNLVTDLAVDEILVEIRFPKAPAGTHAALVEVGRGRVTSCWSGWQPRSRSNRMTPSHRPESASLVSRPRRSERPRPSLR